MLRINLMLTFLLFGLAFSAQGETLPPPQLTVHGEAVLQVPADQATLRVGVDNDAETAERALAENGRLLQRVEQALIKAGLEQGEYHTGRIQVQPRWSQRPRNAEADWRPRIVGYTVSSSFNVKTQKLKLLGALIEAASTAGANAIGEIGFGLADPRKYRAEAIAEATANALADAAALAKAAGIELDGILNINLDSVSGSPVPLAYANAPMARMAAAEAAPPIVAPEDLEVRTGVGVVYRIRSR